MDQNAKLAVIIPAYKPDYLEEALHSLSRQTVSRFHTYVSDDGSPHCLNDIVQRHASSLHLTYRRFDENLGRCDLAAHWNRSVRFTTEPWVWLFSDDDVAEPECVESFFDALTTTSNGPVLYRFNTRVIDGSGSLIKACPCHPATEKSRDFVTSRLTFQRESFAVEYIFSRTAFDSSGGFVSFPLAWNSDDATWARLAGDTPIVTLAGPRVHWRKSGANISSTTRELEYSKLVADFEYASMIGHDYHRDSRMLANLTLWVLVRLVAFRLRSLCSPMPQFEEHCSKLRRRFHRWSRACKLAVVALQPALFILRAAWMLVKSVKSRE